MGGLLQHLLLLKGLLAESLIAVESLKTQAICIGRPEKVLGLPELKRERFALLRSFKHGSCGLPFRVGGHARTARREQYRRDSARRLSERNAASGAED